MTAPNAAPDAKPEPGPTAAIDLPRDSSRGIDAIAEAIEDILFVVSPGEAELINWRAYWADERMLWSPYTPPTSSVSGLREGEMQGGKLRS